MAKLNPYSSQITQKKSQGASQAMLYATGMTREDMDKAQVGIASVWYEGNSCNMHLNDLAADAKKGVGEAGTIGAPPAIVNAALDALAPLGVERLDMPLTPERVWRAIREARDPGGRKGRNP